MIQLPSTVFNEKLLESRACLSFGNTGNLVFRRHIYDNIDKGIRIKMDVKSFIFHKYDVIFEGEVSLVKKLCLLLGQVPSKCRW